MFGHANQFFGRLLDLFARGVFYCQFYLDENTGVVCFFFPFYFILVLYSLCSGDLYRVFEGGKQAFSHLFDKQI